MQWRQMMSIITLYWSVLERVFLEDTASESLSPRH